MIDPGTATLAAAGVNAAVSGLSNLLGFKSNKSANEINLQIARETNQANKDLYQQQFEDSLYLWNKNNEYNDAQSQVARLSAAGLNPAMAFGDSSSASMAQLPSAAPAQGATFNAWQPDIPSDLISSAFLGSLSAVGQYNKDAAETEGITIDNMTRNEQNRVALLQTLEQIRNLKQSTRLSKSQQKYVDAQEKQVLRVLDLFNDTYDSQKQALELDNAYKQALKDYTINEDARRNVQLAIEQYQADTGRMLASAQVNQLNNAVEMALRLDERETDKHVLEQYLRSLDGALKRIELKEGNSYHLFADALRKSQLMHTKLKDMSWQNKLMEISYGIGLSELAGAIRDVSGAAAVIAK